MWSYQVPMSVQAINHFRGKGGKALTSGHNGEIKIGHDIEEGQERNYDIRMLARNYDLNSVSTPLRFSNDRRKLYNFRPCPYDK
jgi:hypothetical protein